MRESQLVDTNLELSAVLLQCFLEKHSIIEGITDELNLSLLHLDGPKVFQANLEHLVRLKEQGVANLCVVVIENAEALQPRVVVRV